MTNKDIAAALACAGFKVFPLKPFDGVDLQKAKRPLKTGWQAAATDDAMEVLSTWPSETHAPGVRTDGLAVLDIDVKSGGLASLERLRPMLPRTFTVRTPSGGFHYVYRTNAGRRLASRAFKDRGAGKKTYAFGDFDGVDVRAEGGLVVGPGATVDGKLFYEVIDDAPIAELPDELADLADTALPPIVRERGATVGNIDSPINIEMAIKELQASKGSIEGQGGDSHLIAVANSALDWGVSPETLVDLMTVHWNPRCQGPWEVDELHYKVASAARSRRNPIGCRSVAGIFEALDGATSLLRFPRDLSAEALMHDRARDQVRGLLGRRGLHVLYGDSGAGKSFIALDLAWALAAGKDWNGRKVNRTAVLYVCAEGEDGFKARVIAARQKHGDVGDWFAMLAVQITLGRHKTDNVDLGALGVATVVQAVAELREATGAENVLVVLDTLARVASGNDENKVEDMMHFIGDRVSKGIQGPAECASLIVHHTNKNGVIRGSTALYAAADLVLRAECDKSKTPPARSLIAEKVKDGREGKICDYILEDVLLGVMPDGEEFGSCVVRVVAPPKRRRCEAVALEIITAAIESGVNLSPSAKSANYAPKYCVENQGERDFSPDDYQGAITDLEAATLLAREEYKSNGRACVRYVTANNDAAFRHVQPL
jgi:hypothetical protein